MVEIPLNTYCVCVLVDQLCLTLCDPQAAVSMGFSMQEYWSGLPFPSPGDLSEWLKLNTNNTTKTLTTPNTEKNVEEQELSPIAGGTQKWERLSNNTATSKDSLSGSNKLTLNVVLSCNLAIVLLDITYMS